MAAAAVAKKDEGNAYFKARDFENAVRCYSEAIELDSSNHVYFSNRSMAYACMNKWTEAAEDGKRCISLDPTFLKGYHRAGAAMMKTGEFGAAVTLLEKGLVHHPSNADLQRLLVDLRGKHEMAEKARLSGMARNELLKEEANKLFKAARFEDAIHKYTEALEATSDKSSNIYITILNNRAACKQQLSDFSGVIADTSEVLEHEPNNIKALLRRGLAFEGLERYRSALSDIRQVLSLDPSIDIANKAQHRIGGAVRRLKASGAAF